MATCALSISVGRHATARSRYLASSRWSSTACSRPAGGTLRPTQNIFTESSTTPFSTLSDSALQQQQQKTGSGDDVKGSFWDAAAFLSLAAFGSAAALTASPNRCSMEGPTPLATSSTYASPASPLSGATDRGNKVQIGGRFVQRRSSSIQSRLMAHEQSELPSQFQFRRGLSEAEEAAYQEEHATDVLSDTKPYEVSVEAFQGRRETMEDEIVVCGGGRFAGVFDGHGGGDVSGYLKKHLYHLFLLHLEQNHWLESDSDVEDIKLTTPSISAYMTAIRQAMQSVEKEVIRHSELTFVGSTAVAVILHENPGGYRTMISANVGDSRAILSRNGKAMDLTKDHKPTSDSERKRILRAGGRIFLDDTGVHRVMNLSLSRAIGDGFSKPIVSPEPDIRRFRVEDDGDEFILLASDGLWDVMSSQDAVDFVKARLREAIASSEQMGEEEQSQKISETRRNMAKMIVQEAYKLGTADNTSVVMVWLKDPVP